MRTALLRVVLLAPVLLTLIALTRCSGDRIRVVAQPHDGIPEPRDGVVSYPSGERPG